MPLRRRISRSPAGKTVNPEVFRVGDGTWSYFQGDPVYPNVVLAARAWRKCRREVWAATHYTQIPAASTTYDGLTSTGFGRLWGRLSYHVFPAADVLAALVADRAAVAAFREKDPSGARAIADFVDLWLTCLSHWEDVTRRIAHDPNRWLAGYPAQITEGSHRTYGDIVLGNTDGKAGDDARSGSADSQERNDDDG